MVPILTVLVPVLPCVESDTDPTACTLIWSPVSLVVHVPLEYVPLTALNVVSAGYEYSRNVTFWEAEVVRPLESAAVTVIVLAPADRVLEDVTSAPLNPETCDGPDIV